MVMTVLQANKANPALRVNQGRKDIRGHQATRELLGLTDSKVDKPFKYTGRQCESLSLNIFLAVTNMKNPKHRSILFVRGIFNGYFSLLVSAPRRGRSHL